MFEGRIFTQRLGERCLLNCPPEDEEPGKCGMLLKSMYGTRDAAQNWECEYAEFMVKTGFKRGDAVPCEFYHVQSGVRVVVHGDDFTILGDEKGLNWFQKEIKKRFEVKVRGRIGPGVKDDKSIRLLNRVFEWSKEGIKVEADQRHAELIVQDMGLNLGSKGLTTPGVKVYDLGGEELTKEEVVKYRSCVARGNYMAQDRSDVQYAVKELCRKMSDPKKEDWDKLKRLARYLVDKPRSRLKFNYQRQVKVIDVYTDTDFAGCVQTRKSTSGGVIMFGSHMVKSWSSTQGVISLSSGEAEYYGLVKGAAQGLGVKSMLKELGVQVGVCVKTDASAAKGIALRRGS